MTKRFAVLASVAAIAGLLLAGCGKERPFATENGNLMPSNGMDSGAVGAPGAAVANDSLNGAPLGERCAVDSGCVSGHCIAGRCCESACDGVCQACSESGRCDAFPADDARCEVITCAAAATTCAAYPATQSTDRCEASGVCKTDCDPLSVQVDTLCGEVAPGIQGLCNAEGDCVDPRAAFGAACQSNLDCAEGSCVDGVCCREACNGACETCDATGTCAADALASSCGEGLACFGRGLCLEPNGSECAAASECGSNFCQPAAGGGSVCCEAACPAGLLCNSDGACVSADTDLGVACTDNTQCIGGRCVDGVCCDSECTGSCERCNAPGQVGRCTAEPAGTVDPLCAAGLECAGRGQCLARLGAACTLNAECRSGECGAALQGTGEICCEQACPDGQRCNPNGSCVAAPRPDGSACTVATDCASNSCVDGRCCESACNGVCQACSALGDCNVSPGNDPSCMPVDCPTSNTVCVSFPADVTTNLCAAFGTCRSAANECAPRFATAGTPCEAVAPGVAGVCDGSGNCTDPRVGLGTTCTTGSQCTSGLCSPRAGGGSICCNEACTGVCEACSPSGTCEFRENGACPLNQQCQSRTTCGIPAAGLGESCANGAACAEGICAQGFCRGQCVLDESLLDQCVLAP
jgi:hypothetical protein